MIFSKDGIHVSILFPTFLEGQSHVDPELPGNYSSILKWSISALPLGDPGSTNGFTKSMVSRNMAHPYFKLRFAKNTNEN
jgi:hypothetical protein